MSNFNELHQMSGVSSISTISHCSGKLISRVDFSPSSLDHHSSSTRSGNKFATARGTNSMEQTMKSLMSCEENIGEHIKANIVYQCLKETSLNHTDILSEDTASKLKTLLLILEFDRYKHSFSSLKYTQDEGMLLGINDLQLSDLNSDEKLEVKCCVETILREKLHNMMLRYETLGGNIKEALNNTVYNKFLECYDTQTAQWRNKIEELAMEYESVLLKYTNLMNKWNKLKYEDMSHAYVEKSEYLLLQAQIAELQAKITKLSCMIKMFMETPTTVDAFKMLNKVVEEKLKTVTDEIRQKEDLKKLYNNLKNTEYDEVLKNYLQLCRAIDKKKKILNELK